MPAPIADLPVFQAASWDPNSSEPLRVDAEALAEWLVLFLRDECIRRRGSRRAVVGVSGGVDSAVTTYLCARAFGSENTFAFLLPYRISSPESLEHGRLVAETLGVPWREIDITPMVDGYVQQFEPDASPRRVGNVCARCRTTILFDQSAKLAGLPIGTGNKTERLFGYFTWHADDAPPINPLGDLFKTQVRQLAEYLGVPEVIRAKPPTADLIRGQTDEGDLGVTYEEADRILYYLVQGWTPQALVDRGFRAEAVEVVRQRVSSTHWKRRLPTVAVVSATAIGEFYLRPVDY
jgi:NAD+ synthetase